MSVVASSVPTMAPLISQLTIDCTDPQALAAWWREALGWTYVWDPAEDDDEIGLAPADESATPWLFIRVPELKSAKNRLHLDIRPPNGSSQQAELERLLSLGATRVDIGQGEVTWHVLADPEGNEFCLLKSTPDELAARMAAEG